VAPVTKMVLGTIGHPCCFTFTTQDVKKVTRQLPLF
jgi:hypothetical protein